MSDSPLLTLPYLAAAQAQKHVTHNEALSMLDGLVHLAVISRDVTVPPVSPANGDRYLIPAASTGAWTTHAGQIALRMEGAWRYVTPREGWILWVSNEDAALTYNGAAWVAGGVPTSLQNLTLLGVNATADATNKLSVNSSAILFNNIGSNIQLKFNKNSAIDTASMLFQTGFSGRAEIGTTGDDDFHFKVSANGSTFNESIVIVGGTGLATFKNTMRLEPQAGDPASPANGQLWYNSTSGKFRGYQNGASIDVGGGGGGGGAWGSITGTLSAQTDLQSALNAKLNTSAVSTFGASLVDDIDAAAARTTLALGTAATQASTAFAAASHSHTSANITDFNAASDSRIAAASVNALADVIITTPSAGQVIKYNGSNWINDTDATGGAGGQSAILFQDEGTNLGAAGTVDTINIKGDNIVASRSGNVVTIEAKDYRHVSRWAAGGSTTITAVEAGALTATGTATAASNATTNSYTQQTRLEYLVTVAAATAVAGWRFSTSLWWRGNAAGLGGFRFRCRWGNATGAATATNRAFTGMANNVSAPTDVEPSSLTNMVGMGWDAADANVQIMTNDATGLATKIDLGVNFPVPAADRSEFFELELFCDPNAATMSYRVVRGSTGIVATGSIAADLPANTALLSPRGWMSVGGTSSVIGTALMTCEIGSDY